jgi:hypothetical protein
MQVLTLCIWRWFRAVLMVRHQTVLRSGRVEMKPEPVLPTSPAHVC